jgi:hypothetical protein
MRNAINKILYAVNYVLARDIAGRALHALPDDMFLVSYPKSGNTWTRFLLGNLMNPDEGITFANVESKVPDIYAKSRKALKKLPHPRLIKSHECFDGVVCGDGKSATRYHLVIAARPGMSKRTTWDGRESNAQSGWAIGAKDGRAGRGRGYCGTKGET